MGKEKQPPPLPVELRVRYGLCVNGFRPGDEMIYTDSPYIRALVASGAIEIVEEISL